MPWIHFHLSSKGQVNACCVSNIKYGNINNSSIEEIWNDEVIKKVRDNFSKGESDKRCSVCINRELAGAKSIRQETFDKYKNVDIDLEPKPIYFDIRFSNVCNFRCRTCWHGASSKWFNDAKILKTNMGNKAIINNINDFEEFISKNGSFLHDAKEIYFAGGEPLVTEEHYLLLDYLIKHKITNLKLRYNTNFSILKFKGRHILDYWKLFSDVEILASIDESDKLGEYIRKELDWSVFINNREKIRALNNVTFKISPTVSIFNISTLPDFYKKCLDLNLIDNNGIYINILDRPFHYSCKVLSDEDKVKVTIKYNLFLEWCSQNEVPPQVIKQFQDCIDFMNYENHHDKYGQKFMSETKRLDEIRNEDYTDIK
jgi:MoaA/NifB/PqqE/SkfB family radical SAM enzyme